MKLNKRTIKNFHKRFANGEQDIFINACGNIVKSELMYYWQENAIYNHILPIVENMKHLFEDVINEDLLYGEYGLVASLIPIQRAYNSLCNRKVEYINRLTMGNLIVEDGSVDIDNLEEEGLNAGKILVYRQGANAPTLITPNIAEFDFFEAERQRLLEEFDSIRNGFCSKCYILRENNEKQEQLKNMLVKLQSNDN